MALKVEPVLKPAKINSKKNKKTAHRVVSCDLVPWINAKHAISQTKVSCLHKSCYHLSGCVAFNPSDLSECQRHVKTRANVTKLRKCVHLDTPNNFHNYRFPTFALKNNFSFY